MDVTLYRYRTNGARWNHQEVSSTNLALLVKAMNQLPFQGDGEDFRRFGFAQCGVHKSIVYGVFVQKFPKTLTDYDPQTKEENIQTLPDSGEFLFIFYPERYEIYFQTKRSSDLPPQETIIDRLIGVLQLAVTRSSTQFFFSDLEQTRDEVDRRRIVDLFYEEADEITELELEGFDSQLVHDEKQRRHGARQKYFNPIEEYQEAMEEATLRLGNDAEKVTMKAKKGHSFKKDPIARAALEASRKPVKMVYTKDSETYVEYGVTKKKEVIHIEAEGYDLSDQIENIIGQLSHQANPRKASFRVLKDDQTDLFT